MEAPTTRFPYCRKAQGSRRDGNLAVKTCSLVRVEQIRGPLNFGSYSLPSHMQDIPSRTSRVQLGQVVTY